LGRFNLQVKSHLKRVTYLAALLTKKLEMSDFESHLRFMMELRRLHLTEELLEFSCYDISMIYVKIY